MSRTSPRRGLAIGCGGTVGAAWIAAALDSVATALNWDPREADALVGTSAGAEFVTMLGSGVSVDDVVAMQAGTSTDPVLAEHIRSAPGRLPPAPRLRWRLPERELLEAAKAGQGLLTWGSALLPSGRGDAGWLQRMAERLNPGRTWVPHPATWLAAMDYATGQRVAFGSPEAPAATIGQAIRASWAIPGWFPPVPIAGRRYVDGGTASTASVDLLLQLELDELVVIAPMASTEPVPATGPATALERQLRRRMSEQLDREVTGLRDNGTKVLRLHPDAEDLAVMGANFMDPRRRLATFEHSLSTTRRQLDQHNGFR
ncbi:patatin-like phospholipase family protein [Nocardia spumae]|uniref:patatin-like phospholipase family protein n=1 Tax=Nocardia spumae TaxID=2887190 RepID=UPI001D1351D4|nr:patatin-like phospholipase family protein [Nocardia spumae]